VNLHAEQQDWMTLIAAVKRSPVGASFRDSSDDDLRLLLQAPVAVAWWIDTFAPELADRERLDIGIVCAPGGPAFTDDGRPYQLVPLLLERPKLEVFVTLIVGQPGSAPVPPVAHDLSTISLRAHPGVRSAPATIFSGTLEEWRRRRSSPAPDLCLLFHPAFDESPEFWQGLRPLLAAGVRVGSFGRGAAKLARDAWLLRAYGYDVIPDGVANPWAARRPESLGHGAWAASGWELRPAALPPARLRVDRARLARAHDAQQFIAHEFQVWNPHDFIGRAQTAEGDTSEKPERFVGLPDHYALSLATGEVWAIEADRMIPAPGRIRLPQNVLATYPDGSADGFEQFLWAIETYVHEYRPREAAETHSAYNAEVAGLQVAAALNGHASAAEIEAMTEFYIGGSPLTPVSPGSEPLFAALRKRNWEKAAALIDADPALARAEDVDGRTPLFHAMAARNHELARRWLEAGADPNHLDHEGFAVVHDVAKRAQVEPLELLQRYGADLDLATGMGFTPAMIALRYGCWPVLAYLLAQHVDLRKTALPGASVAEQYQDVSSLPRVLRREIERQLGRPAFIPIARQAPAHGCRSHV
jgi:hypothetical protein